MQRHADLPHRTVGLHLSLEIRVDIAVQPHSFLQPGDFLTSDRVALADVTTETDDLSIPTNKGETVAVVEDETGVIRLDRHNARTDAIHRSDALPHRLGCVHRRPLPAFPVQKQFRVVAVEGFLQIGFETAPDRPERGATVFVGMAADQGVQRIGIGPDNVPDVGLALETTFDLERIGASLGEVFQAMDEVEILQGQEGPVPSQHLAIGVLQIIERPAGLDAGAAVRAAAGQMFGQIALSAVADAQGPVDKAFQFSIHGIADGTDLRKRQFPLQHEPTVAQAFGKACFLRRSDGALGGGVKDHPFRGEPRHGRVLHDQGVYAGLLQFPQQPSRLRNLFLVHQRIESHIDADTELVCIFAQPGDILHGIARRLARPESRTGDIDGIGSAVDGRDADVRRTGGSQELKISPLRLRLRSK